MTRKLIESHPVSYIWWAGVAWLTSGVAFLWIWITHGEPAAAVPMGLVCMAVGGVLMWIGARRLKAERAFNDEWARAKLEWNELRRGAAAANLQGRSVEDYVRERGYRVPAVVRAIVHDLSVQVRPE